MIGKQMVEAEQGGKYICELYGMQSGGNKSWIPLPQGFIHDYEFEWEEEEDRERDEDAKAHDLSTHRR